MSLIPLPQGVMTPGQAYSALSPLATHAANLYSQYGAQAGRAADIIGSAYSAYRQRKGVTGRSAPRKAKYAKKSAAARTEKSNPTTTRQFGSIDLVSAAVPQRTLITDAIPFPPQGASVGLRLGSVIRCSGFKVCERFVNTSPYLIRLHYAVLQPKDRNVPTSISTEFFRSTNINTALPSSNSRTLNFTDCGSGSPYLFSHDCYPINPDRYNVLTHQRVMLGPKDFNGTVDVFTTQQPRNCVWEYQRYFNMKGKKLSFTSQSDTVPENSIQRVFWWQVLDDTDWGTDPQNVEIRRFNDCVVYFKNGLN